MTTTIGYVRVSTSDQTVENQKQQIKEAGYHISKWYVDEAVSGSVRAVERSGFSELLNYVREGDTLVVVGIDRLGRNTIDVLSTVETLQAKGVKVISLREGFDLSTPVGKAMLTMMAGLASPRKTSSQSVEPLALNVLSQKGFTVVDQIKQPQNRFSSFFHRECHQSRCWTSYRLVKPLSIV